MVMVRNMVTEYIKDSRTIILAVLPCNIDIANQEVLTLAGEYDKGGERTLGILTKPDLVETEPSAVASICRIVANGNERLTLGYYIVKSRGPDEDDAAFESRKKMFSQVCWSNLDKGRVGVEALKTRLSSLLGDMARREFPKLKKEIDEMLRAVEKNHKALGPSREDESKQRIFLSGIAGKFQELVRSGLEARYAYNAAFEESIHLRLITQVVFLADEFSRQFEKKAPFRNFKNSNTESLGDESDDDDSDHVSEGSKAGSKEGRSYWMPTDTIKMLKQATRNLSPDAFPELDGVIAQDYNVCEPKRGIMDWLTNLYLRSRGMELGTFSDDAWASAWREQSSKWSTMSHAFASRVIMIVHRFITLAIEVVCPDNHVRDAIWSVIQDELLGRYKQAIDLVTYLITVERNLNPYTLNRHFNQACQEAHARRVAAHIFSTLSEADQMEGDKAVASIAEISKSTRGKSNVQDVAEKLHDDLSSYYDVARKRFVDNIWAQVVGAQLLFGPGTPLKVLTQDWVIGLNAEQLDTIAGESASVREQRASLARNIMDLKAAKNILKF